MRDYPEIVRQHLISEGLSNVFRGTEKPSNAYIPDDSIFVAQYGGFQPQSEFGSTEQIHQISIQVLVRSNPGEEDTVQTTANDVYDALRNASPTGTMVIQPNSPPLRLSIDDSDRYKFSINCTVSAQE